MKRLYIKPSARLTTTALSDVILAGSANAKSRSSILADSDDTINFDKKNVGMTSTGDGVTIDWDF